MDTGLKQATVSTEKVVQVQSGWTMLPLLAGVLLADIGVVVFAVANGTSRWFTIVSILLLPVCIVLLTKGILYSSTKRGSCACVVWEL